MDSPISENPIGKSKILVTQKEMNPVFDNLGIFPSE